MERLTIKTENGYKINLDKVEDKNILDCRTKLGKLEDLEEELGCPLEVLFKALGNNVYDETGKAWYIEHYYQEFRRYEIHSVRYYGKLCDMKFKTKDYKKTWWLKADKSE